VFDGYLLLSLQTSVNPVPCRQRGYWDISSACKGFLCKSR